MGILIIIIISILIIGIYMNVKKKLNKYDEFVESMRERGYKEVEVLDKNGNVYKGFCSMVNLRQYYMVCENNVILEIIKIDEEKRIKDEDVHELNILN